MTREEAIKIFNEVLLFGKARCTQAEFKELAEMSIKALEQEPSDDYVSRQAVLEKINDWWGITSTSGEPTLCDCIRELPSVTPTQKWIPVSEGLPEKNGKYLAYIINKKDANLQYIMTCEYYEGDLWNWFPDDDCASDNVVAWMSLPEPYKAEMESEE